MYCGKNRSETVALGGKINGTRASETTNDILDWTRIACGEKCASNGTVGSDVSRTTETPADRRHQFLTSHSDNVVC